MANELLRQCGCAWLGLWIKQLQFSANMYIFSCDWVFYFSKPHLWTNYFYTDFGSIMDLHTLACKLSTEERPDFDFSTTELSDISNWVSSDQSLETCCSDDSRGLPSPVQDYSSFSAIHSRSSYDTDPAAYIPLSSASKLSSSCPSSPREYGLPESSGSYSPVFLSCPPSWLELRPQLEDEAAENHQVPLSSSPPEFTSSSPTSDISSELGKEEGSSSLTSASSCRSDTASISSPQHSNCGQCQDQFSQRLHDLLVLVLRGRELARSRTEETDCTTCTSRSDDSDHGSDNQALKETRYSFFHAYIYTKTLFWGLIFHVLSRSTVSLSYLSDEDQCNDKASQQSIDDVSPIRFEIPSNKTFPYVNITKELSLPSDAYIELLQTPRHIA